MKQKLLSRETRPANKLFLVCLSMVLLLVSYMLSSCTENEMLIYSDTPALYFEHATYGQQDSINQSFFILDTKILYDTVWVNVCTQGFPVDHDRPIKLIQTNTGNPDAAVAGVHYVEFDDTSMKPYMVIPAGEVFQKIPVICLRDKSLELGQYRLEMTIGENEEFRPGIDEWRNFVITMTDMAVKPKLWDSRWRYYFGPTWGSVKMRFIIQSTGYTDFDTYPSDFGYVQWLGATAKQALILYNETHPGNPLCEADGTLVTFD